MLLDRLVERRHRPIALFGGKLVVLRQRHRQSVRPVTVCRAVVAKGDHVDGLWLHTGDDVHIFARRRSRHVAAPGARR